MKTECTKYYFLYLIVLFLRKTAGFQYFFIPNSVSFREDANG